MNANEKFNKLLEGKNGREVFNVHVFLSPYDVWTAGVLPDPASGGARIGSYDASCVLPAAFSASPTAPFLTFSNASYSGANDDGGGATLDREKEDYFEIIEMATYASNSTTGIVVTHVNGVPPCGSKLNDAQATIDAQPPTGGLYGGLTLISVNAGTDYTADATALASFYRSPANANYQSVGSTLPNLTQATPDKLGSDSGWPFL